MGKENKFFAKNFDLYFAKIEQKMSLYAKWMKKTPQNPKDDIMHLRNTAKKQSDVQKFLNSLDMNGMRENLNIISLVFSWKCDAKKKKEMIDELILMGVDMDCLGISGLNPLHFLLVKIVFGNTKVEDETLLYYLIKKGINWKKKAILPPLFWKNKILLLKPFEFYQFLLSSCENNRYFLQLFPKYVELGQKQLTSSLPFLQLLEEGPLYIPTEIPMKDYEMEYWTVRWKLPFQLSPLEIKKRLDQLSNNWKHIDIEKVKEIRENLLQSKGIYLNSLLEEASEFHYYEYVQYVDVESNRQYFFHKRMLPSLWKSSHNPLTGRKIPFPVLKNWLQKLDTEPFIHDIVTLSDMILKLDNQSVKEEDGVEDAYYFFYNLIVPSHPYTNIYNIKDFNHAQIRHLSDVLSRPPFRLLKFNEVFHNKEIESSHFLFLKCVFNYIMNPKTKNQNIIHHLHFALEECLQDFSLMEQIKSQCDIYNISFHQNSFELACDSVPEINDLLVERHGFWEKRSLKVLWNRLIGYSSYF